MYRPITHTRRRLPLLGGILTIVLTGLTAFAQTPGNPDASRPSRTEKRLAPDVVQPAPPDVSRPPRIETPPVPPPDAPKARPTPPTDAPPAPVRGPTPDAPRDPQPNSPRTPPPTLQPQPRPDLSRPRPDATLKPRPDLSRPQPDTPVQPRPDSSRVRQDIARPDKPKGPELEVPRGPPPVAVQINTLAIIATNKDNRIDPALRELAAQLKPTFRFSGYRLARSDAGRVALGQPAVLRLAGPYTLQVIPTEADAQHVVLNVQALQNSQRVLNMQVRLRPGRYQLLGGWPVSDGTLLAAVAARAGE